MDELVFHIWRLDDGGYTAVAQGHAIFTEAASLEDLRRNARDATRCHFDHGMGPKTIRLEFARQSDTPA
ncbi:MAG TPA: hypothetical protein VF269_02505 [Rhodanobacteraceae bacterium]